MYFIHARKMHTVQADRGTGPVLTCVVQAAQKTNTTTIFKIEKEPIRENFRPREMNLPVGKRLEILRAIAVELSGAEAQNKAEVVPQAVPLQAARPFLGEGALGLDIQAEFTCVVAKDARSRPPKFVKVRCALCHLVLADRSALKEHECNAHVRTDFKCSCCSRSFNSSEDLRRHARSTSHAIPAIFQLPQHSLEESGSLDCSTSSPPGETVGMQRMLSNLSCLQEYQIAESTRVGSCGGFPIAQC